MRVLAFACVALTACTLPPPAVPAYSEPEASGLVSVRAYPTPNDVCRVIGENAVTVDYLDHTATLIGCPGIEMGAIQNRINEGASRLEQVGSWVLLSVPD